MNILKSIDERPYQMGTVRETLAEGTERAPQFGPERPRVYSDLSPKEKDRYNADIRAINILLQGLPKDIYTLINHYTDAKYIWDNHKGEFIHDYYVRFSKLINDMRNIKITMSKMQLNSKFVNNMLPEWGRFVIARYSPSSLTSSSTQVLQPLAENSHLDSSLSPAENLIENLTNTLALLTQSYKTFLPQTNNQLRTSSNARNQAMIQDGRVVVQNVQGDKIEVRGLIHGVEVQLDMGELITELGMSIRNSEYYKDKMLLMQAQENRVALDVEQLLFLADDCDAFDFDVDEAATTQTMFMANLSSAYPITDEAEPSYDSDILSENTVVKNSLTAELATYKEQVELYERRAKFELTKQEQKINEQLRLVISDRNFKEETLKKELHFIKLQLASTINHNKSKALWETKSYKSHEDHMKDILHQRMWGTKSYKSHEDHMQLCEALEKSMNRDHSKELAQDLAKARPSGAFGSSQVPPPPPPPPPSSTNQESQSKSSATLSSSKTAALTEYQAWTTTDIRLRPSISLTHADLQMDEDMAPMNKHTLASNYLPPPEDSLLALTGDIATFIDWFCKGQGITKLKPQDLEGPAFEIVKVFHPDVIHLQYQMEECHKLLTDSVDHSILRHNVSKPLPLGGPPGSRPALSISKIKAAYYPDAGLEQMVLDQFWIEEECKYDIAAMYGISHWWFQRQRFYIDRHTSKGDRNAVKTHMVNEFRINRMNPGLKTRFWTKKDVDRRKAFMFAIQKRLKTRRIFRNLESFVGGRVRDGDYKLLKLGFQFTGSLISCSVCFETLRLRMARTAAKPCQRDSLEFYLITGSIYTNQQGTVLLAKEMSIHNSMLTLHTYYQGQDDSWKTYNTASTTLTYVVMFKKSVGMRVLKSQPHKMAILHNKDD
uniref:Integrase, catalytic region, zinc finger, CCHC-type, peptidase aspartic, catalytic n=1 Tax=Tanacetum cinerariifolium TaxID=118510 RepID=A0A6L2NZT7_TANCI|nr:hypothetical protein [Tanacetum cinerariifolium]